MPTFKQPPTLRDLLGDQQLTGESDMSIILKYLDTNDLEEQAIDLISKLVKSKISKYKQYKFVVQQYTPNLHSKYLYETYPPDVANMLHSLQLDYIANSGILSDYRMRWAREYIPNIEMPKAYYQPLIEYLDSNDIRFKDEEPIEKKVFIE